MENFSKLLELLPEDFLKNIIECAKILIPSLLTLLVTKYTLCKPQKQEIQRKQFECVYLPLYLLTQQYLGSNYSVTNLPIYFKKIDKLVDNNYPLVYPKTIKLFAKLKSAYNSASFNKYHLANFQCQVESDYEKLKRTLGYPTNSFFDFFRRLSFFNKIIYIAIFLFAIMTLYFVGTLYLLLFSGPIYSIFENLLGLIFCLFSLYLLGYIAAH